MRGATRRTIPDQYLILLGTMSDGAVSRLAGVNRTTVTWRRTSLGIPAYVPPLPLWYAELTTSTDCEICARHGALRRLVYATRKAAGLPTNGGYVRDLRHLVAENDRRKINIDQVIPHLGRESDKTLSIRFGVSAELLRRERVRQNIPVGGRTNIPKSGPKHEQEPPPNAPIRPAVVTPSPAESDCTFYSGCRCQFCRPRRSGGWQAGC